MFIFQENNSCSNAKNQTMDKLQHKIALECLFLDIYYHDLILWIKEI